MTLVPTALVRDQWFRTLSGLPCGALEFIAPDGDVVSRVGDLPGPSARFHVHDWAVLQRAVARGDIGLGEDYIAGGWDTDDVEALITYFLLNFEHLDDYANGSFLNRFLFVLLNTFVRRNSVSGSRRNIEAHYDVGNDFYALWLDETMTYSSALYRDGSEALGDAQRNKYARILSRLAPDRRDILEIGCGWGGFAERAADAGCEVTGVTISPSQHAFASRRLGGRAEIRLEDYRRISGRFGSIVSIEMLEAVGERYWPQYFQVLCERLRDGGHAVIQTILIRDELFSGYRRRSDFIRHYVFPGGMLPSLARLKEEAERAGLKIADVFPFGQHYARTLREWSSRMREHESDILALGHKSQFMRNWQFYLGMCAAAFAVGRTDVAQIEFVRA